MFLISIRPELFMPYLFVFLSVLASTFGSVPVPCAVPSIYACASGRCDAFHSGFCGCDSAITRRCSQFAG